MATTHFLKNGKVSIKNLTMDEYDILSHILSKVQDIMSWDEDMKEYTDHDNFIMSMSEEDYNTLMAIDI